jgi:putative transposase
MPDHVHLLVEALRPDSDLRIFIKDFKQHTSFCYKRSSGHPLWQDSYHDHVLREDEESAAFARYVLGNPVRAGLVHSPLEWPYLFSERYEVRELLESVRWQGVRRA